MIKGVTKSYLSSGKPYFCSLFLALSIMLACKKDKKIVPDTGSRTELTKDSIFLYAKQAYLWYNQLPEYDSFKPRGFNSSSEEQDNLEAELFALTRYAKNS